MTDCLKRLILIRHGETEGQSSIRYYGVTDVPLSHLGREQARAAKRRVGGETYQAVWASTLCRSWESAGIVAPGSGIRIDSDLREIDFGDWEGLTKEEIAVHDPAGYARWQEEKLEFAFPGGETRGEFRMRVGRAFERMRASRAESVLVVAHKGVVRTLLELASGFTLEPEMPVLGGVVHASRNAQGRWYTGRQGSDASCSEIGLGIALESDLGAP